MVAVQLMRSRPGYGHRSASSLALLLGSSSRLNLMSYMLHRILLRPERQCRCAAMAVRSQMAVRVAVAAERDSDSRLDKNTAYGAEARAGARA